MKKIATYLKDVYEEFVQKVNWPKWSDLQTSAIIVMVASIIISIVIFVLDIGFFGLLKAIYGIFY
jgi:preprotein translocase subunit SecE